MADDGGPADVEWLLELQAGVASTAQLTLRGISATRIRARVEAGRWQRMYPRTVITHSGPIPYLARAWAAVLWAGETSMASHDTAGFLLGIVDGEPRDVHLAIPERRRLAAPNGVVLHRTSRPTLDPRRSPPQTTVERTTLDLIGAAADLDAAVGILTKVLQRRLTNEQRLLRALVDMPNVRWHRAARELLTPELLGIHSPLEWRYARDVERAHALPASQRQRRVRHAKGGSVVQDVWYEDFRVVVELDGRIGHREDHAFRDMARDNRASERGELTLRYGWVDVNVRSCGVATQVARLLRARGWQGMPRRCGPACTLVTP
jgi:very-short-patch-repair endonuclease